MLLALGRGTGLALHDQLERALREQVRSGRLAAGTRVPSTRALAAELGVSRGVVLEAYAQLTAEGYLTASQGAPTRVATVASVERAPVPASSLERRPTYQFDPGLPDLAAFPRAAWLRSLRTALRQSPFDALGHGDPRGTPELRNELMAYLSRARGAAPEPEHTVICTGFVQGFALLCRTLRARGVERVAIEDPGWAQHRLVVEGAGLEPVGIPVDELGIDVAELRRSECDVVVLTPAHQYPTGVVLSSERRAALLDWAEDEDALIVEDDYDSELRYDREAVGALQGLAPERVCCLGSVSTRLAPAPRQWRGCRRRWRGRGSRWRRSVRDRDRLREPGRAGDRAGDPAAGAGGCCEYAFERMHGTYETIDERPALRFELEIAHPVEVVWGAITEPSELEQWFPSAVEVELRVGGAMTFTFREHTLPDGSSTMHGRVTDLDPPRLFAFYWGDDHLRFELEPRDAGAASLLRFTVLLDSREKAARDGAGWHVCLDRLERQLAGAPASAPGTEPTDEWRSHYEEYQRRGLPAGAPIP